MNGILNKLKYTFLLKKTNLTKSIKTLSENTNKSNLKSKFNQIKITYKEALYLIAVKIDKNPKSKTYISIMILIPILFKFGYFLVSDLTQLSLAMKLQNEAKNYQTNNYLSKTDEENLKKMQISNQLTKFY